MTPALAGPALAADTAPSRRATVLGAAALFACLAVLYTALRQHMYVSDGRTFLAAVAAGDWIYHHLLYLPAAHAAHALLRPLLGEDPEAALFLLSAASSAAAGALVFLALRELRVRLAPAGIATLAMAFAPSAWLYATAIEVHALQLAASAAVVLWAVRAHRRARLGNALAAALGLVALAGTHMVGLLWLPALALVVLRPEGTAWRRPRHLVPALLVLLVSAASWVALGLVREQISGAGRKSLDTWRLVHVWEEWIRPPALLWIPVLIGAPFVRGRARELALHPLVAPAVVLFATFAPFAFTTYVSTDSLECGPYFVSLLPPLAVLAGLALQRLPAWSWGAAALLLVPLQLGISVRAVWRAEHGHPGADWMPALIRDMDGEGLVLTRDYAEWQVVVQHSRLDALAPREGRNALDLGSPALRELAMRALARGRASGRKIALTRGLIEADDPELAAFAAELQRRLGAPRPGTPPAYAIYDPPDEPR